MEQKKTVVARKKISVVLRGSVWLMAAMFTVLAGILGWALAQVGTELLTPVEGRVASVRRAGEDYQLVLAEFPARTFTLKDYFCAADLTKVLTAGENVALEVSKGPWEAGAGTVGFRSLTRDGESLVSAEEVLAAERLDGLLSAAVVGSFGLLFLIAAFFLTCRSRGAGEQILSAADDCISQMPQSFYLWYLGRDRAFQKKRKRFLRAVGLSLGSCFVLYLIAVPVLAALLGDLDPLFIGLTIGGAVLLLAAAAFSVVAAARYWTKNAGLFARELWEYLERGSRPDVDFLRGQTAENEEKVSLDLAGGREIRFEEGKARVRLPDLELGGLEDAEDLLPGLPSAERSVFAEFADDGPSEAFFRPGEEVEIPVEDLHLYVRCRYFNGDIPVAVFVCSDLPEGVLSSDLVLRLTHGLYRKLKENGVGVRGLKELQDALEERIRRLSPRAMFGTVLD